MKIQGRAVDARMAAGVVVATLAGGLALAGMSVPAGGAPGADARAEFDADFTARAPGAPTGVRLRVLYKHPEDPEAKPPPLTAALFELPAGTRIDGSAAPACEASDEDLRRLGRAACPPESQVGSGGLSAMTGAGAPVDPVLGDVTVFNGGDELIELVTAKGTEAALGFDRLSIEGHALRAHPPVTPGGPPDGRTAIREVEIAIPARGRLLVTPGACPREHRWTSRGSFEFTDGGRSTVVSTMPCEGRREARARTRLTVRPRRAVVGRRIRFRARASSTRPACARHATVRFGGRTARTNGRGRAVARVRFARAGLRVVRLRKRGCPAARARVRVVRD